LCQICANSSRLFGIGIAIGSESVFFDTDSDPEFRERIYEIVNQLLRQILFLMQNDPIADKSNILRSTPYGESIGSIALLALSLHLGFFPWC
jgi:hypothetical protein